MFKQVLLLSLAASAVAFAPSSRFTVIRQTALAAEPADKDYEAELKKLEKEAEERLDAKVAEMMSNLEKTGAK